MCIVTHKWGVMENFNPSKPGRGDNHLSNQRKSWDLSKNAENHMQRQRSQTMYEY